VYVHLRCTASRLPGFLVSFRTPLLPPLLHELPEWPMRPLRSHQSPQHRPVDAGSEAHSGADDDGDEQYAPLLHSLTLQREPRALAAGSDFFLPAGRTYDCRANSSSGSLTFLNSDPLTSFERGAKSFARCIQMVTPDFSAMFTELVSPSGLNQRQFEQYCSCWGTTLTVDPPNPMQFSDCYNQALGRCLGGDAYADKDQRLFEFVIRRLGLAGNERVFNASWNFASQDHQRLKDLFTGGSATANVGHRCAYFKETCGTALRFKT
jgi:hypothetical protein